MQWSPSEMKDEHMSEAKRRQEQYELFYAETDWGIPLYKLNYHLKAYLNIASAYAQSEIKSIVDMGCGTGDYSYLLDKNGYEVTGIDFSGQAIKKAKSKYPDLRFIEADGLTINLHEPADLFFVNGFSPFNSHSKDDYQALLNHWSRLLKENGNILIVSKSDLSGKTSESDWIFHTDTQLNMLLSNSHFSYRIYYFLPVFRYLFISKWGVSLFLKPVSIISKYVLAKTFRVPVRYIALLEKC